MKRIKRIFGKKILFPTRIALVLVIPSLFLYVFFNIWPMLFSIGIAFTNADRYNITPNPQRISDLENAIQCATILKGNETYRQNSVNLLETIISRLDIVLDNFKQIKSQLEAGVKPADIPMIYFNNLFISSRALTRIRPDFAKHFNCTEIGYVTSIEILPKKILGEIDSLITLTGTLAGVYRGLSREELYGEITKGYNITIKLREYLYKLEANYEGYMDKFIESASSELDRLELKFNGFTNFNRLFLDPRFYNSLYKTLLFVVTSVPLKVSTGVLLALFYSSMYIYGRKTMRALLMVPWAIPFLLSALTWKFLFLPNGQLGMLLNLNMNVDEWHAFLVYNLFETWLAYPFVMTITQGALRGVSRDVIEAAYVDGAGLWKRTRRVVFPLIAKPVFIASILTTGASLQAFLIPLVLNGAGPRGEICTPITTCTAGLKNEMLIIFGYNRIMIDGEFGYAASMYIIVLSIILIYVAIWFKVMGMGRGVR